MTQEKKTATTKKKIQKINSDELAGIMGIHPYRLGKIRRKEGLEPGFMTTQEELQKLYDKYCKEE